MSIEQTLTEIAANGKRTNELLEKLLAAPPKVAKPAKETPPPAAKPDPKPDAGGTTEPESNFLDDEPPAQETKKYTRDEVRAVLQKLQKATGKQEDAFKVLQAFGAKTLGGLAEDKYGEAVALAEKSMPKK